MPRPLRPNPTPRIPECREWATQGKRCGKCPRCLQRKATHVRQETRDERKARLRAEAETRAKAAS
jgi:hypothetical protein